MPQSKPMKWIILLFTMMTMMTIALMKMNPPTPNKTKNTSPKLNPPPPSPPMMW